MNTAKKSLALILAAVLLLSPTLTAYALAAQFKPAPMYSFLDPSVPVQERIDEILSLMTLEEKIAMSAGGTAVPRLGLNSIRMGGGEALHGVVDRWMVSTVFPTPFGLSHSWDKELLWDIGDVIARESLANNGGPARLAPVLDILRDPRAGRSYEQFGEDPYLVGTLGEAITAGMNQRTEDGYIQFIPILKHPLPYNTQINRLWTNIVMPPRTYHEYFARSFKYAISSGNAKSLMNTYQLVNGKPFSINPIQREILDEWTPDYEGTGHYEYKTINDYGSGSSMFVHSQRYFPDTPLGRAFGVAQGAINGQMSWSFRSYGASLGGSHGGASGPLFDALARGFLTEEDFEENARRALATNIRLGDFDQLRIESPYLQPGSVTSQDRLEIMKDNREVAFRATQEQIVLLKNDGILPLQGSAVEQVILLGPLADQVLNDHYTGARLYSVTIKDALENKLGEENVLFDRAVDTVAIKAYNGKYLVAGENPVYRQAGTSYPDDTPVMAVGEATSVTMDDIALLFERYDYGSTYNLLRAPINNQYVQVTPFATNERNVYSVTMINNTSSPGEANRVTGATSYVNYQTFRIVPTIDGKWGLYNLIAGNGSNGGVGMAYDADDEDLNNGSYLMVTEDGYVVADLSTIGPYRNEVHQDGPDITQSKVDKDGTDEVIDSLREESKFELEIVRSVEQAIDETISQASDSNAPIVMVLGYEPHLNAREAIDLYHPGLSDQQMRMIEHVTHNLGRDVILVIKTGNPMTIDERVANNERVKAILLTGHSSQEEGSALVSVLFDDGYSVPKVGFKPQYPDHNIGDNPDPFQTYPGWLENEAAGTISPASPAGRLSATWFKKVSDMVGASEDHPPASYRYPLYDEETNDNLSNINGTIPTGLMVFDIIKGERTHLFFNGEPLYPFGYGLTYTEFEYSDVSVSPVEDGKFVVSGNVTNKGRYTSDEVVQVYSSFVGAPSRIKQANQRLIAYDRLHQIKPGETRAFAFEIDMLDTMGVFDVEAEQMIVEAGDYIIRVAGSSHIPAKANNSAVLTVTAENGGAAPAVRKLDDVKLAANFDDYSNVGGRVDDIELVSASIAYASNTAVLFRKDGAWIVFKDVEFTEAPKVLTAAVGSDRESVLEVYALRKGANPAYLEYAAPAAVIPLRDTRPVKGLPTGLGIGPVGVNPGTPEGQTYADAYVKPEWEKVCVDVDLAAGSYDIYFRVQKRGVRLDWFKFGTAPDKPTGIAIDQLFMLDSIRKQKGTLELTAVLEPVSAMGEVSWTVTTLDGKPTELATIDEKGVLQATGKGNGTVLVTASVNDLKASKQILITNQLDENKVLVNGEPKTAEYILITTEGRFGQLDSIMRYKGTNQQTVIFNELFEENPNRYYLPGTYLTVTPDQINWKLTDLKGNPTDLAVIDEQGLVTATGKADGKVVVHAELKSNPHIRAERVITLQNQSPKDAFSMIQAEHFDLGEGYAQPNPISAFGPNGNELGLSVELAATEDNPELRLLYNKVSFGEGARALYLRMATEQIGTNIHVLVDGKRVGSAANIGTGSIFTYATFKIDLEDGVQGIHDLELVISGSPARINWFQFQ